VILTKKDLLAVRIDNMNAMKCDALHDDLHAGHASTETQMRSVRRRAGIRRSSFGLGENLDRVRRLADLFVTGRC